MPNFYLPSKVPTYLLMSFCCITSILVREN